MMPTNDQAERGVSPGVNPAGYSDQYGGGAEENEEKATELYKFLAENMALVKLAAYKSGDDVAQSTRAKETIANYITNFAIPDRGKSGELPSKRLKFAFKEQSPGFTWSEMDAAFGESEQKELWNKDAFVMKQPKDSKVSKDSKDSTEGSTEGSADSKDSTGSTDFSKEEINRRQNYINSLIKENGGNSLKFNHEKVVALKQSLRKDVIAKTFNIDDFKYVALVSKSVVGNNSYSKPITMLNCTRAILCLYDLIVERLITMKFSKKLSFQVDLNTDDNLETRNLEDYYIKSYSEKAITTRLKYKIEDNKYMATVREISKLLLCKLNRAIQIYNDNVAPNDHLKLYFKASKEDQTAPAFLKTKVNPFLNKDNKYTKKIDDAIGIYLLYCLQAEGKANYILKCLDPNNKGATADKLCIEDIIEDNTTSREADIKLLHDLHKEAGIDETRNQVIVAKGRMDDVQAQLDALQAEPNKTPETSAKILEVKEELSKAQVEFEKSKAAKDAAESSMQELLVQRMRKEGEDDTSKDDATIKQEAIARMGQLKKSQREQDIINLIDAMKRQLRERHPHYNAISEIYERIENEQDKEAFYSVAVSEFDNIILSRLMQLPENTQIIYDDDLSTYIDKIDDLENVSTLSEVVNWIVEGLAVIGQEDKEVNQPDKYKSEIKNVMKHIMSVGMTHWYYASNLMYYDTSRQAYENCRALCILHLGNIGGGMVGSLVLFPTAECTRMYSSKNDASESSNKCKIIQMSFVNESDNMHVRMLADWAILHVFPPVLTFAQTIIAYDHVDYANMRVGSCVQLSHQNHGGNIAKIIKNNNNGTFLVDVYKLSHCRKVLKDTKNQDNDISEISDATDLERPWEWVVKKEVRHASGKTGPPIVIRSINIKYEEDVITDTEASYEIPDKNMRIKWSPYHNKKYYVNIQNGKAEWIESFSLSQSSKLGSEPLDFTIDYVKRAGRESERHNMGTGSSAPASLKAYVLWWLSQEGDDDSKCPLSEKDLISPHSREETGGRRRRKRRGGGIIPGERLDEKVAQGIARIPLYPLNGVLAVLAAPLRINSPGTAWGKIKESTENVSSKIQKFNILHSPLKDASHLLQSAAAGAVGGFFGGLIGMEYGAYGESHILNVINKFKSKKKKVDRPLEDILMKFALYPTRKSIGHERNIRLEFDIQTKFITMAPMIMSKLVKYSEPNDPEGFTARYDIHSAYDRLKKSYDDYKTRDKEIHTHNQNKQDFSDVEFQLGDTIDKYEGKLKSRLGKLHNERHEIIQNADKDGVKSDSRQTADDFRNLMETQIQLQDNLIERQQYELEDKLIDRLYEVESFSRQFLHAASELYNHEEGMPVNAWQIQDKPLVKEYKDTNLLDMTELTLSKRKAGRPARWHGAQHKRGGAGNRRMKQLRESAKRAALRLRKKSKKFVKWLRQSLTRKRRAITQYRPGRVKIPPNSTVSVADSEEDVQELLRNAEPLWRIFMGGMKTAGSVEMDIKLPIFFLHKMIGKLLETKKEEDSEKKIIKDSSRLYYDDLDLGSNVAFVHDVVEYEDEHTIFPTTAAPSRFVVRSASLKTGRGEDKGSNLGRMLVKVICRDNGARQNLIEAAESGAMFPEVKYKSSKNLDSTALALEAVEQGEEKSNTALYCDLYFIAKDSDEKRATEFINLGIENANATLPEKDNVLVRVDRGEDNYPIEKTHSVFSKIEDAVFKKVKADEKKDPHVGLYQCINESDYDDSNTSNRLAPIFDVDNKHVLNGVAFTCEKYTSNELMGDKDHLHFKLKVRGKELLSKDNRNSKTKYLQNQLRQLVKDTDQLTLCVYIYKAKVQGEVKSLAQLYVCKLTESSKEGTLIGRIGKSQLYDESDKDDGSGLLSVFEKEYIQLPFVGPPNRDAAFYSNNLELSISRNCRVASNQALSKEYYVDHTFVMCKNSVKVSQPTDAHSNVFVLPKIKQIRVALSDEPAELVRFTSREVRELSAGDYGQGVVVKKIADERAEHRSKVCVRFPDKMVDVYIRADAIPLLLEKRKARNINKTMQKDDFVRFRRDEKQLPGLSFFFEGDAAGSTFFNSIMASEPDLGWSELSTNTVHLSTITQNTEFGEHVEEVNGTIVPPRTSTDYTEWSKTLSANKLVKFKSKLPDHSYLIGLEATADKGNIRKGDIYIYIQTHDVQSIRDTIQMVNINQSTGTKAYKLEVNGDEVSVDCRFEVAGEIRPSTRASDGTSESAKAPDGFKWHVFVTGSPMEDKLDKVNFKDDVTDAVGRLVTLEKEYAKVIFQFEGQPFSLLIARRHLGSVLQCCEGFDEYEADQYVVHLSSKHIVRNNVRTSDRNAKYTASASRFISPIVKKQAKLTIGTSSINNPELDLGTAITINASEVPFFIKPVANTEDYNKKEFTAPIIERGPLVYRKFVIAAGVLPYDQFLGPFGHHVLGNRLRKIKQSTNVKRLLVNKNPIAKITKATVKAVGTIVGAVGDIAGAALSPVTPNTVKQAKTIGKKIESGGRWIHDKFYNDEYERQKTVVSEYLPFATYYVQSRFKLMVEYGPWHSDLKGANRGISMQPKWNADMPSNFQYAFKNVIEGPHKIDSTANDEQAFRKSVLEVADRSIMMNELNWSVLFQTLSLYMFNHRQTVQKYSSVFEEMHYGGSNTMPRTRSANRSRTPMKAQPAVRPARRIVRVKTQKQQTSTRRSRHRQGSGALRRSAKHARQLTRRR